MFKHCSLPNLACHEQQHVSLQAFDVTAGSNSGPLGAGVKAPVPQNSHHGPVPAQKQADIKADHCGFGGFHCSPYKPLYR